MTTQSSSQAPATTDSSFGIPCCPPLPPDQTCDIIDFRTHLTFPTSVKTETGGQVSVDVTLHTRFTRCPGPLVLGNPVYSTTLLPGETVRLATSDSRSRFSFDSETNLSYRSEQMSEEQYRMTAMRAFMSDSSTTDRGSGQSTDKGSWDFHGDASGGLGFFSVNADTNANGSHNAQSTYDYLAEHTAHASMADNQAVEATHKAHSLSIGEVSTRAHKEGESEDHFESSSRQFSNSNRCHAVTYLFYRINKLETVSFTLEAIERRVIDPAAPIGVVNNPIGIRGNIAVVPQDVVATKTSPVAVSSIERQVEIEQASINASKTLQANAQQLQLFRLQLPVGGFALNTPIPGNLRQQALEEVDRQLISAGLLTDVGGAVSSGAQETFSFQRTSSLPTAGVVVKGCLDDCDVCEPDLIQDIQLDLERKSLENKLLARQIDLLDKSQEYRCCPDGTDTSTSTAKS